MTTQGGNDPSGSQPHAPSSSHTHIPFEEEAPFILNQPLAISPPLFITPLPRPTSLLLRRPRRGASSASGNRPPAPPNTGRGGGDHPEIRAGLPVAVRRGAAAGAGGAHRQGTQHSARAAAADGAGLLVGQRGEEESAEGLGPRVAPTAPKALPGDATSASTDGPSGYF